MAGSGKQHLRPVSSTLMRAEDLRVEFPSSSGRVVSAVAGLSLDMVRGETLSLVGESGCGKSTLGRSLIRLQPLVSGSIIFEGADLASLGGERLRAMRPKLGIVFQDPIGSLNPRHSVRDLVAEPLRTWQPDTRKAHDEIVVEMLGRVGLNPGAVMKKRPHELSGGQCQRVSIARALVLRPDFLICDEPVSALDVSIQAQVLNLLRDLREAFDLTVLFISHDLAVVKTVSDRVVVMYLGKFCEIADDLEALYSAPAHPYSEMLLASVPRPGAARRHVRVRPPSEPPSPSNPPSGCRFRTRCPRAQERCAVEEPQIRQLGPGRFAACHFPLTEGAHA
jgi:peptide/nickel transport system ATP-binding protein